MLVKHGTICSRLIRKTTTTAHLPPPIALPARFPPHRVSGGGIALCTRASPTLTAHLPCARQLSSVNHDYRRGTDSEKAREWLARLHDKTVRRFGCQDNPLRDKTELQPGATQCRVTPRFLENAQPYNGRHYLCRPNKETGKKELVRLRITAPDEPDLLCSDDLHPTAEVREIVPTPSGGAIRGAEGALVGTHRSGREMVGVVVSSDAQSDIYIIHEEAGVLVKRLHSGHQLQWISDTCLLYTTINSNMRPDSVFFFDTQSTTHGLLYKSDNNDEVVSVSCSKDRICSVINVNTKLTSHIYVLDNHTLTTGNHTSDLTHLCGDHNLVCSRKQGIKCYIEHHQGRLLSISSTPFNPNLQLHLSEPLGEGAPLGAAAPNVSTFAPLPLKCGVVHEVEAFERGLVVYHTPLNEHGHWGKYEVTLLDPADLTKTVGSIKFPPDVSLVSPNNNPSSSQTHLNIKVHSYTKPMKQLSIPFSKFSVSRGRLISRGRYEVYRDIAQSGGVEVPLTVIAKEECLVECTPCLFLTYGCYGETLLGTLETLPRQLLDAGWKVVLCHVRGGGELGRNWYLQGVGGAKENSVLDTLNCIKHIHSLNLSTPTLSALHASSSGALIAARAACAVPGIVSKLVLRFPFLDLEAAMSDPALPLSSEEKDEWGTGSTGFAPLDLSDITLQSDVLLTVAGCDRRAPPWHTANFIASLKNEACAHVHLLGEADHTGFSEVADEVETNFLLEDGGTKKRSGFWERIKFNFFAK